MWGFLSICPHFHQRQIAISRGVMHLEVSFVHSILVDAEGKPKGEHQQASVDCQSDVVLLSHCR